MSTRFILFWKCDKDTELWICAIVSRHSWMDRSGKTKRGWAVSDTEPNLHCWCVWFFVIGFPSCVLWCGPSTGIYMKPANHLKHWAKDLSIQGLTFPTGGQPCNLNLWSKTDHKVRMTLARWEFFSCRGTSNECSHEVASQQILEFLVVLGWLSLKIWRKKKWKHTHSHASWQVRGCSGSK